MVKQTYEIIQKLEEVRGYFSEIGPTQSYCSLAGCSLASSTCIKEVLSTNQSLWILLNETYAFRHEIQTTNQRMVKQQAIRRESMTKESEADCKFSRFVILIQAEYQC